METKKYPSEPYSNEWEKDANSLARSFAPEIYPCSKCGAPVVNGYCCCFCGDTNPSSKKNS